MYLSLINEDIDYIKSKYENKPFFVFVSLTNTCNANCVFCDVRTNKKLLNDINVYNLIDELAELGTKYIHFTGGGEPFTDKNILDYMEYASNKGINIVFISNGYMLDESKIISLSRCNIKIVFLSIDSFQSSIHNTLRRTEGLYERATSSINLLKKYIPTTKININHVLNKDNIDDFENFINLKDKYNFDFINPILIKDCPELTPTDNQIQRFNENKSHYITLMKEKNIKLLSGSLDIFEKNIDKRGNRIQNEDMRCAFANFCAFVDCPTGLVYPCDCSIHRDRKIYCIGDLHNNSFKEIWQSDNRNELIKKLNLGALSCKSMCDEANCLFNRNYYTGVSDE